MSTMYPPKKPKQNQKHLIIIKIQTSINPSSKIAPEQVYSFHPSSSMTELRGHTHLFEGKCDSRRLRSKFNYIFPFRSHVWTGLVVEMNLAWAVQDAWLIVLYWCKVWKKSIVLHGVYARCGWWEWDAPWLKTIKVILNSDSDYTGSGNCEKQATNLRQ